MSAAPDTQIQHRRLATNGIHLHVAVAGKGPLVLLVHGWPELWYSWRHQFEPLVRAGYRVAAVDVRGYGESDKPSNVGEYGMRAICADNAGVIAQLGGGEPAVVVGHDWGGPIAWNTALLHPEMVRAVGALSVPHFPRGEVKPMQLWRSLYSDQGRFFYQLYFQDEGVAEAEFEADMRRGLLATYHSGSAEGMRRAMEGRGAAAFAAKTPDSTFLEGIDVPQSPPDWLGEEALDYYVRAFQKGGMRGPLNRYRCQDDDWEDLAELAGAKVQQPAFFVAGELDPVLAFVQGVDIVENMKPHVPDLRLSRILDDCGHWTQQEKPAETNEALLQFLAELDG